MTLFRLLTEGSRILKRSGNRDSEIDARQLLLAAFHMDLTHYLLNRMQEYTDDGFHESAEKLYREMIARRSRREPLQQILGTAAFMGLDFYVNSHVLIPRQDTEVLVEQVLKDCLEEDAGKGPLLLDLCTGSGCIAVSLAVKGEFSRIDAADICEEALKVAQRNALALRAERIAFYQGDLFEALPRDGRQYDIITSNPPYIPTGMIAGLEPEVKDYEPRLALDGSQDGLYYYKKIAVQMEQYLKAGGRIYLEIGCDQGEAVCTLMRGAGFQGVKVYQDLAGRDRVVYARKRQAADSSRKCEEELSCLTV